MAAGISITFESQLSTAVSNVVALTRALKEAKGEVKALTDQTAGGAKKAEDSLKAKAAAAKEARQQLGQVTGVFASMIAPATAAAGAIAFVTRSITQTREEGRQAVDVLRQLAESYKAIQTASGASLRRFEALRGQGDVVAERAALPRERALRIVGAAATQGFSDADALAAAQLERTRGVDALGLIQAADRTGVKPAAIAGMLLRTQAETTTTPDESISLIEQVGPLLQQTGIPLSEVLGVGAGLGDVTSVRKARSGLGELLQRIGKAGIKAGTLQEAVGQLRTSREFGEDFEEAIRGDANLALAVRLAEGKTAARAAAAIARGGAGDDLAREVALRETAARTRDVDDAQRAKNRLEIVRETRGGAELRFQTLRTQFEASMEEAGWSSTARFGELERVDKQAELQSPAAAAQLIETRMQALGLSRSAGDVTAPRGPAGGTADPDFAATRAQAERMVRNEFEIVGGGQQTGLFQYRYRGVNPAVGGAAYEARVEEVQRQLIEALHANTAATLANTSTAGRPEGRDARADDREARGWARSGFGFRRW